MSVPSEPVYAELHCKTNFSFLCGASHPEELAARAAELGYRALAITDRNTLAGVVRAHAAAKNAGMKLLVGAEIVPQDAPPVLLLAPDHAAYRNLSSLITRGRRAAEKGECSLFLEDVADYSGALLAAVIPSEARIGRRTHSPSPPSTGERGAEVQRLREEDNIPVTLVQEEVGLARYREIFGDRCFLAASLHCSANDEVRLQKLTCLAKQATLPLVATNDVHYHDPEPPATAGRADRHPPRRHRGRAGRPALSQRRTLSEIAGADGGAVRAPSRGARTRRRRSPTAARFRSTSCVTNIPRSCVRRG